MVVVWPALSTVNFARMSIKPKFHFNHLLQRGEGKQGPIQFSMLANSGFLDQDTHMAEKIADIDAILKACDYHSQYPNGDCECVRHERPVARPAVWVGIRWDHRVLPGDRGARGRDLLEASLALKTRGISRLECREPGERKAGCNLEPNL
jgi:hypothetical protein